MYSLVVAFTVCGLLTFPRKSVLNIVIWMRNGSVWRLMGVYRCVMVAYEYIRMHTHDTYIHLFDSSRPGDSPAKHGQRWPDAPLNQSPPESHGKTTRHRPTPQKRRHHQTKQKSQEHTVHRPAPMWCGAGEVLGEGWRCGCSPRSCRA